MSTRNERKRAARNKAARKRVRDRSKTGPLPDHHVTAVPRVRGPKAAAARIARNTAAMVDVTATTRRGRTFTRTEVKEVRASVLPSPASRNGKRHASGDVRAITARRGEPVCVELRAGQLQPVPRASARPGGRIKMKGIRPAAPVVERCDYVDGVCSRGRRVAPSTDVCP